MTFALSDVARLIKPANFFTARPAALPHSKTILVAEDDEAVRNFAAVVIHALGYEAIQAPDGRTALQMIAARGERPVDLLLTDLMMPMMSGKELAMRLWDRFPMQRVIFFSGYSEPMARRMWRLSDNVTFIQKPFSSHTLAAKLRQALGDH